MLTSLPLDIKILIVEEVVGGALHSSIKSICALSAVSKEFYSFMADYKWKVSSGAPGISNFCWQDE